MMTNLQSTSFLATLLKPLYDKLSKKWFHFKSSDFKEAISNRVIYDEDAEENITLSLFQDGTSITYLLQHIKTLNTLEDLESFLKQLEAQKEIFNAKIKKDKLRAELSFADVMTGLRLTDKKIVEQFNGSKRKYWRTLEEEIELGIIPADEGLIKIKERDERNKQS